MNRLSNIKSLVVFLSLVLGSITVVAQPLVTINGLAVRLDASLTATVQGSLTNQTSGASLGTIDNAGTITLTGDWTNNSANTVFSTNTGAVQFIGTAAAQTIGGSNSTGFYNLTSINTFATAPQLTISKNTVVKNTLTMTKGTYNLGANNITIGTSAASPGSLVHGGTKASGYMYDGGAGGTVTRYFGTSTIANRTVSSGLFPMGDKDTADFRPFYVACPATAPTTGGTITVNHFESMGVANVSFMDDLNIIRRDDLYWRATTGGGLAGGTYNLSVEGTHFGIVTNVTHLRLTQIGSVVGTPGVNAGTTANPQVNRTGVTLAQLTDDFYVSSVDLASPLPIELLNFTATPVEQHVLLKWTTATETNNAYFTVERTQDGSNYEFVAKVDGAGNSTSVLHYSTIDPSPYKGISYYRLKQTDYDGKFTYSNIEMVNFDDDSNFSIGVYPNPTDGISSINIAINAEKFDEVLVVVYDVAGNETFSKVIITEDKGVNVYAIDPSGKLAKGVYFIRATSKGIILNKKLVVN